MERHIDFTPSAYAEDLRSRGIACEAWFPLGGTVSRKAQLSLPAVQSVAGSTARPARRCCSAGSCRPALPPSPGSANEAQSPRTSVIFDFTLDADDLAALAGAGSGKRVFDVPLNAQVDMIMGFKFND